MSFFASLNGERVIEGRIVIPSYGAPSASVTVDKEIVLPASGCTLSLAGLSILCSPWRAPAPYQGRTMATLVGGFGGWSKPLPGRSYASPGGVRISTVIGDAARECGERIALVNDRAIGVHYMREADSSGALHLNYLLYHAWRIDPDGVTRNAPRATSPVLSSFSVVSFDGARKVAIIATDTPQDIIPGRTLTAPTMGGAVWTINGVTHTISSGAVRTEILIS